jgi:16S rRNA processing protein RimM
VQLVVGRIGRPHGIRGEVTVEVRTDDPGARFAPGSVLATDPSERGPLTVERVRWHSGRLLVGFEGSGDRDAAESLRGTILLVDSADLAPPDDPEEFYDHQLVDLTAISVDGAEIGVVTEVLHTAGQDLLVVRRSVGGEVLVPFVAQIVPKVDVPGKRLVIDPPEGLL